MGVPIFGVLLPFIGVRRLGLNMDGSHFDSGEMDILDEASKAPAYADVWVVEWLGFGRPLAPCVIRNARTGEPIP